MCTSRIKAIVAVQVFIVMAMASGCKTVPKVEYREIRSDADLTGAEFDKIALQRSTLHVDAKPTKEGDVEFTTTSTPAEVPQYRIGLHRRGSIGVKTNIVITKIDNTDLAKEIGTEVIDTRVDIIKQVGSIVVALVGFALDGGNPGFSLDTDTYELLANHKVPASGTTIPIDLGKGISVKFGPVAPDAQLLAKFAFGKESSVFPYAACRTATVMVQQCALDGSACGEKDKAIYTHEVRVSDARYFESVGLPVKGKVTMHSQCGASVSTDKDSGVKSGTDIAQALVAQGVAIKEAIEASKEKDKKE